jgi:hypothetical protein
MRHRVLFVACAFLAGCGPAIQSANFSTPAPEPTTAEILLYSTKLPECPYEEVGLISGRSRVFWTSQEAVLAHMRERAREMGGDAIVGLGTSEVVTGGTHVAGTVNVNSANRMAGTVVRFTDPDCRR